MGGQAILSHIYQKIKEITRAEQVRSTHDNRREQSGQLYGYTNQTFYFQYFKINAFRIQ